MKIELKVKKERIKNKKETQLKLNKFMFGFWLFLSFILFEFNNDIAFLFNISTLFAPLPFAVISMATSCYFAVLLSFIASLAIGFSDGFAAALTYFALFSFSGVLIAFFLKKNRDNVSAFFTEAIEFSVYLKLGLIAALGKLLGRNVALPNTELLQKTLAPYASKLPQLDIAGSIKLLNEISSKMFPTTILLFVTAEVFLCYIFLKRIAKKQHLRLLSMPRVSRWSFAPNLFWALFASFIFEIASKLNFKDFAICEDIAFNIQQIVWVAFFIQGFAFVMFFLEKKHVKPFFKYILAFFTLVIGFPSCILSLVGAADVMWNFRKLKN
ncbi:MAG: DUF2232 domain-containing protein [Synergistaceae bacterium]|nr:DUF2232 domain-containing protein [Synergistaceae bacterium]